MTKSVAGFLFLPGLGLFLLATRNFVKLLSTRHFYIGLFIFITVVLGYYLLREYYNSGYLKAVWENELAGRYLTILEEHQAPFNYYYENMKVLRYTYWFYFLLPAFLLGLITPIKEFRQLSLFNLLLTLTYGLIISAAQTKLEWYDLPLYPFFALQIGLALMLVWSFFKKRSGNSLSSIQGVLAVGLMALIFFIPAKNNARYIFNFKEDSGYIELHKQGWYLH